MEEVELLAPAGNWHALLAAVNNGANAIYLGGGIFNARQYAGNFSDNELDQAVQYCHVRGIKLYITLNTLIHQREIDEAARFISFLSKIGVDGVIIQDVGIARLVRELSPELPVHGSTQMTIHNTAGVRMLKEMGFSRIVLAREMPLEEIKSIAASCDIELETFVHGSLCVSYSGQCLMSSLIGGRSGNRGRCAQPCRLPYELRSGYNSLEKGYLLSTKDLCTISFLDEIIASGVESLKIEGRMKRPEYVAVVVSKYRKALDYLQGRTTSPINRDDWEALLKIFHRGGFTKGYYYGVNEKDLMGIKRPNHWGIEIGRIEKVLASGKKARIFLQGPLYVGDGIEVRSNGVDKGGLTVSYMEDSKGRQLQKAEEKERVVIPVTKGSLAGDVLYKTTDILQLKEARFTYMNEEGLKIPLEGMITLRIGEAASLQLRDEQSNCIEVEGGVLVEAAEKRPLKEEDILRQVQKTGATPYIFNNITVIRDENSWLPVKELNNIRRKAIEAMTKKRFQYYHPKYTCTKTGTKIKIYEKLAQFPYHQHQYKLVVQVPSVRMALQAFSSGADSIYYRPSVYSTSSILAAKELEVYRRDGKDCILVIPNITTNQDLEQLDSLLRNQQDLFDGVLIGNVGALKMAQEHFVERVYGDFYLNIMNAISSFQLRNLGFSSITLSPELTCREIHDIIKIDQGMFEFIVYGRIPLMTLAHCPIRRQIHSRGSGKKCAACSGKDNYFLRDRKGMDFPLRKTSISECTMQVLNSQILCMAEHLEKLGLQSINRYRILIDREEEKEIHDIVSLFRKILDGWKWTEEMTETLNRLKEKGITYGHFFRGVE